MTQIASWHERDGIEFGKTNNMSLRDLALPLIKLGIPVVPARPGMRRAGLNNWDELYTTDQKVIDQWDKQYPDWNLVAVADPEHVVIIDIDNIKAAQKLGMPDLPETFGTKSPKGFHAYFLPTERTLAWGHGPINVKNSSGELVLEVKLWHATCAAPGCKRDDGKIYKSLGNPEMLPFPEDLADWVEVHRPILECKDSAELDPEFNFEEFLEFFDLEVVAANDPWFHIRCPFKGDFHTNEGKPDIQATGFRYDQVTLGWKCLAANCEGADLHIGEVIKRLNEMKGEPYRGVIWPNPADNIPLEQIGADEADDETIEEPVVVKPGSAPPAELMRLLAEDAPQEKCYKRNCHCGMEHVEPKEQPEQPKSEPTPEPETESGLKYPELAFPYDALPAGRFKDLVDNASEGGLSPGLTAPALMCIASSLPAYHEMDGDRIGTYVCLLALVGAGKDLAMKRAIQVLGVEEGREIRHYTPNGERAVALQMGDHPGTKADPGRKPGPARLCMITPELEETLRKSKAETSGVLQALQYFYDYNYKTVADSRNNDNININCRLSWLTALPVGKHEIDRQAFKAAFGENTGHGLASRMLFGFSESRVDPRKCRKWVPLSLSSKESVTEEVEGVGPVTKDTHVSLKSDLLKAKVKGFEPSVEPLYENWAPENDYSGRDYQHVHKVAIITALLNGHEFISRSDWDFAVAFLEWQGRLRCLFTTGRAQMVTYGEMNEIIFDEMLRRIKKRMATGKDTKSVKMIQEGAQDFYFVRWKAMANDGRWYKYGCDIEKAIDSMVRAGTLAFLKELEESADGKKSRWVEESAWIRIDGLKKFLNEN